jgi:hypothetical protein
MSYSPEKNKHITSWLQILKSKGRSCGDTPQDYQRPFLGPSWAPTKVYQTALSSRIQAALSSRIQADQSQNSLFWPITEQFILTNHRQHTNTTDQIKGDGLDSWNQSTGAARPRAVLKTVILFVAEYGSTP